MDAVHCYDTKRAPARPVKRSLEEIKDTPDVIHPLIRTHDETKIKSIYFNANRTDRIVGKSHNESNQILDEIEKISGKYLAIRPRIQLQNLARVHAALKAREFVVPEDILSLLLSSMGHRLHEMSKEEIEEMILESVSFIKLP